MKTIQEVLTKLDEIIDHCAKKENPAGYFACTYRITTAQILREIQKKKFEDNERMTVLDVQFARRYTDAWDQYLHGKKCSRSWQLAFDAAKNKNLLILQHIFLGMNAHINLDLGIAAASVMPPRKINPLKKDFDHINTVLASISQNVQTALNSLFYPLDLIDKVAADRDNIVLDFAMTKARDASWATAVMCSNTPAFLRDTVIGIADYATAQVATRILNPKLLSPALLRELKNYENKNVAENIALLRKIQNI